MQRRDFLTTLAAPLAARKKTNRGVPAWDVEGQQRRSAEIHGLHRKACGPLFDDRGKWIAASTPPGGRERLWHSMSMFPVAHTREKANEIVRETFAMRQRNEFPLPFSHFELAASTRLLVKNQAHLTTENRALLSSLVRETLAQRNAIRWLGYNDNFPAMDMFVTCVGGEALDDSGASQAGLDAMRRLLQYFKRRGLLSEYTSSTYTPITLACFADIAEHARDRNARRMALELEHRIWLDLASHFHAPTNILAGPHSRAYNVDSVGHLHHVHMLFYQAFGERVWLNPTRFLFPPIERQEIHHDGDVPFMQGCAALFAATLYHPRPEIEGLALKKLFPFRCIATTEHGTAPATVMVRGANGPYESNGEVMEYAGGEGVTTTFQTADYAVGSTTVQMHDGNQTDAFFVNYRRTPRPHSIKDTGTIFARYVLDDDGPGKPWSDPRSSDNSASRDVLADAGRVRAVQKDGTVLAVYQSKAQFLTDHRSLRLTIVLPTFYRRLKHVALGDREAQDSFPLRSANADIVWIEDELLFAAFRPLLLTNHGRRDAVRVENQAGYVAVNFINYEGEPRRFTRQQLLETCNGFVAEIGSRSEHGTFENFKSRVLLGQVRDETAAGHRIARYRRPGVELDLCHTLYYSQVKYILIDGKPQPRPLFQATGVAWPGEFAG
jgi:hypothetical protein